VLSRQGIAANGMRGPKESMTSLRPVWPLSPSLPASTNGPFGLIITATSLASGSSLKTLPRSLKVDKKHLSDLDWLNATVRKLQQSGEAA
jgi:hypothetical protein